MSACLTLSSAKITSEILEIEKSEEIQKKIMSGGEEK